MGGLHLAFCVLFFAFYLNSHDPEKSMAFVLFIPIDPWIVPLSKGVELNDWVFAGVVTVLGTVQWWVVGWVLGYLVFKLRQGLPNQSPQPTPASVTSPAEQGPRRRGRG